MEQILQHEHVYMYVSRHICALTRFHWSYGFAIEERVYTSDVSGFFSSCIMYGNVGDCAACRCEELT